MAFLISSNFLNAEGNIQFKTTQKENTTYKIVKVVKDKNKVKYLTPFLNHEIEQSNSEFNTKLILRQTQRFPSARFLWEKDKLAVVTNTFSSFTSKDDALKVFKNFKSTENNVYRLYECKIPKDSKYLFGVATLVATINDVATDFDCKTISSDDIILESDITESIN